MATNQFIYDFALTMLAQPENSIAAGMVTGAAEDAYQITAITQACLWITEAHNRITRLCVPISDTATMTATTPGQTIIGPYPLIVSAAGRILHRPSNVMIGTRSLISTNKGFLNQMNGYWFPPDPATGGPAAWVDENTQLELSRYTSTPTFTVQGYFLPTPVTTLTQAIEPCFDDFAIRAIAFYLAWMIAMKNQDTSIFASRVGFCGGEWVAGVKEMYTRLIENDPTMAGYFSPAPVDSLVAEQKQIVVRT